MGYCAYLRKSRADEVREKVEGGYDALTHHRQTLEGLASRMGVQIERWYCDGIRSGDSIESRPEMGELLEAVGHGEWDGVLCMEVERLTRGDMVDQGTVGRAFTESGTLIVTPLKVYDPQSEADMEYFEFGLFMSRREYKAINKRLVAGRAASAREGQFIGAWAPYGYDKVDVDGMHTLAPNSDAPYVVLAFERFAQGDSPGEIAAMLDSMGASPLRSAKWNRNSVRNMLRNPVYNGKVLWNSTKQVKYRENGRTRTRTTANPDAILVDGLHPALIDDELWEAACSRVSSSPVRGTYQSRNHYGRILVCAECGRALTLTRNPGKSPLLTHLRGDDGCTVKGCRLSVMDEMVSGALEEIAEDVEYGGQRPDRRREAYEKSISDARSAIDANFDRMERNVISEEDFVRRRAVLEQRIADAQDALDSLPDASDMERPAKLREAIAAIRDPNVSTEAKRMLIWAIVERIEYTNHAPVRQDDIHLDIYLR